MLALPVFGRPIYSASHPDDVSIVLKAKGGAWEKRRALSALDEWLGAPPFSQ